MDSKRNKKIKENLILFDDESVERVKNIFFVLVCMGESNAR